MGKTVTDLGEKEKHIIWKSYQPIPTFNIYLHPLLWSSFP